MTEEKKYLNLESDKVKNEIFSGSPSLTIFCHTGKYMSVDMMGNVTGRSDAIGPQEQFECVFEEDKVAFETYNGCYLSVNEDGQLSASKKTVGEKETFHVRTSVPKV